MAVDHEKMRWICFIHDVMKNNQTGFKNFQPKVNLNHNIHIFKLRILCKPTALSVLIPFCQPGESENRDSKQPKETTGGDHEDSKNIHSEQVVKDAADSQSSNTGNATSSKTDSPVVNSNKTQQLDAAASNQRAPEEEETLPVLLDKQEPNATQTPVEKVLNQIRSRREGEYSEGDDTEAKDTEVTEL